MQDIELKNKVLPSEKEKPFISNCILNELYHKNFLHGLQNARHILACLERSFAKSSAYEDKLLQCKNSHRHSHESDWPWDEEFTDKHDKLSKNDSRMDKSIQIQKPVSLLESWSTMSIACLQYQYEELSKHYEKLLKTFNQKCSTIATKNSTIIRLRMRARIMHAHLASAHRTLLCIGEKYLALKKKRHDQLQQYDKKIEFYKERVRESMKTAETARLHLDQKLSRIMAMERDSDYAMLLAEMRKCNQLYLENLKLKAQLEEYIPGSVNWNN